MPSSKQTRAIRKCIAENSTPFDRLFAAKSFSSHFPGGFSEERISSRSPRGFDPEHPRINWLKLQAFFVWRSYTLREFSSSTFAERVAEDFTQIIKLNELLDLAILDRWPSRKGKIQNQRSVISALDDIEAPRQKMDF